MTSEAHNNSTASSEVRPWPGRHFDGARTRFRRCSAATGLFDLQLSGIPHGGQVRLPFFGARFARLRSFISGCSYQVRNMLQYTTEDWAQSARGRFNCRRSYILRLHTPPRAD
jgi:hypothetical protein